MSDILGRKVRYSGLRILQKTVTAIAILAAIAYGALYKFTDISKEIPELWVLFGEALVGLVEWCEPSAKLPKTIALCIKYKKRADELYEDYNDLAKLNDAPEEQAQAMYILIQRTEHYETNYNREIKGKQGLPTPENLEELNMAEKKQEKEMLRKRADAIATGAITSRRLTPTIAPPDADTGAGVGIPLVEPVHLTSSSDSDAYVGGVIIPPSDDYDGEDNFHIPL